MSFVCTYYDDPRTYLPSDNPGSELFPGVVHKCQAARAENTGFLEMWGLSSLYCIKSGILHHFLTWDTFNIKIFFS